MALGATRSDVVRMVVRQGMRMAALGVGIGTVAALICARFLSGMLFGLKPMDPVAFFITGLTLVAVTWLASYLPARRATRVDPMVALRYE